jgi:hypothetical protein
MRTTILLDDDLAELFRRKAHERGQSLSAYLSEAGRLLSAQKEVADPFVLITQGGAGVHEGVNLDKTNEILSSEDARIYRPS